MKNSEQPAIPIFFPAICSGGDYAPSDIHAYGLTKLEKACIQLGIPKTGDADLDAIILEANRRDLAAKAMQGLLANPQTQTVGSYDTGSEIANLAVSYAKCLLAELESTNLQTQQP